MSIPPAQILAQIIKWEKKKEEEGDKGTRSEEIVWNSQNQGQIRENCLLHFYITSQQLAL